ncbi:AraC family transcriptional regulator [Kribbella catacumbae]|uniref:AraC family transcriptional regulator n=1 Tax=Kribbella catacumbae TaxID=460086 RepID=UPI0003731D04|nr:AraC family transcriptional regulator [Kribbella catacumbae]
MDALANLLDGPRGRGAFLLRTIMEPPWSLRMNDDAPLGLVAMVRGTSWVVPDTAAARELRAGSVAVVNGRGPITIASDPGIAPTIVCGPEGRRTTLDGVSLGETMSLGVRTWGNNSDGASLMLMGCYQFRGEISGRVLDALPPRIIFDSDAWSSPLVSLLGDEITTDGPGQQAVLDRLFDLLLVSVIRAWFDQADADVPGWYSAHQDPVVGRALRCLHEQPSRPWTVARLAAETGASRSALARCFTERMGVPPMTYLKEWRLARAADLLLDPDLTLDAIARRVGYSDGSTLSTIFKNARGVSPRQYREAVPAE